VTGSLPVNGALSQSNAASFQGIDSVRSGSAESAKYGSAEAFDGSLGAQTVVAGKTSFNRPALIAATVANQGGPMTVPGPQLPSAGEGERKISKWAAYGGSMALGALQGGLYGGVLGALGGALIGAAVTSRYLKGDYGGAIGISAGAVIGTFLGGPVGGLIGGLVGGLVGNLIGRLFKK